MISITHRYPTHLKTVVYVHILVIACPQQHSNPIRDCMLIDSRPCNLVRDVQDHQWVQEGSFFHDFDDDVLFNLAAATTRHHSIIYDIPSRYCYNNQNVIATKYVQQDEEQRDINRVKLIHLLSNSDHQKLLITS